MTVRWVLNASPLISLARTGHEDVLLKLSDEVVVPRAVALEVDDGAARKCARCFSIPHLGTLAVVILARKRGLIPSATAVLRSLQAGGSDWRMKLFGQRSSRLWARSGETANLF